MWVLLLVSVAGFLAQLVDGAMGMAFGITLGGESGKD
jgi:hypothetical protein